MLGARCWGAKCWGAKCWFQVLGARLVLGAGCYGARCWSANTTTRSRGLEEAERGEASATQFAVSGLLSASIYVTRSITPIAVCRSARSAVESVLSLLASSTHFLRSPNILVESAANSDEVMTG